MPVCEICGSIEDDDAAGFHDAWLGVDQFTCWDCEINLAEEGGDLEEGEGT